MSDKTFIYASESGYSVCLECSLASKLSTLDKDHHCPRCEAILEHRVSHSLQKTWALLLAAIILFIPANIYPIMIVYKLNREIPSTIMEGIIIFMNESEYFVAAIIFIASILVPAFKITGLSAILLSIQFNYPLFRHHRTYMYHFIEFIGRWSMLDIFVVAIMITMISFGNIGEIYAGKGAIAFALVVIFTMYATITFDPRLIWDKNV